jgi:phospholipid N-methyltransferase
MASSIVGLPRRSLDKLKSLSPQQLAALEQAGIFLKNFLTHPLMLCSAMPSSRYLIARVLDKVDWSQVRTAVEYGPGIGTFTRPMLDRMLPDARLLAIELNDDFSRLLKNELPDTRLKVEHGSAKDVTRWMSQCCMRSADFVLSGIPYTVLPCELRRRILCVTKEVLAPGGVFAAYQYTRAVLPDLQKVFGDVEEDFEPLNILPARVFVCRKQAQLGPGKPNLS